MPHSELAQLVVAFGAVQTLEQTPQLAASFVVLISQPLPGFLSQSAMPAGQLEQPHCPDVHRGVHAVGHL